MKMEGRYVRALYDFTTTETSEISLLVGDLVKVVRQVDDNWLCGVLNAKTGNFPASFVTPIEIPAVQPGEKLFHAMRTFPAEEQGDLGFSKGEIVLGVQAIDSNWWQGRIGDKTGIFPVTHVKELENVQPSSMASTIASTTERPHPVSNAIGTGNYLAKVQATMDLTAQLDDELSFTLGDIIRVTEIIDEDFAIGECCGNCGQFPIAFVNILEGNLQYTGQPAEKPKSKFRWWADDEEDEKSSSGDQEHNKPAVPTQSPEVISSSVQMRNNSNHQNGPISETSNSTGQAPKANFVQTHRRVGSYTQENTRSYDSDITPYGKALYPFMAENDNELTFFDNEIVNLIRHVDEQWMEGEIDGKRGIFPSAYVEIIVDCPYAEDIHSVGQEPDTLTKKAEVVDQQLSEESQQQEYQQQQNQESNVAMSNSVTDQEKYALVLCDFAPNSERELMLTEGDTVTIFSQLDEHWFEVKHDDGRIGLCPSSYVRVIEDVDCPVIESPQSEPTPPLPQQGSSPQLVGPKLSEASPVPPENISTPATGAVRPPSRPQTKPKPALKPKPAGLNSRSKSPLPSVPPERPAIPVRHALSVDADNQYVPNPKPVVPQRRLATNKAPVFQKSSSMDATLDDLIAGEMNALRTTEVVHRSRSSSATSDYSSIEESRAAASPVIKSAPEARSPDEKYMQRGTAVGSSMFFSSAVNEPPDTRPPMERQRSRPTPSRPPPPPVTQTASTQRQNSASSKRPPPRPTGAPRPVPAPTNLPVGNNTAVDYGPRPVPSRAAPPRPNPARPPAPSKTPANLMDFSPDNQPINDLTDQDREIVADLDNRIAEIQKDLEKCLQARQELQQMLTVTEGSTDRAEAEDNLAFYDANITGLSQEMQQLKESLYEIQPERAEADRAAQLRAAEIQRRMEEEKKHREEARQKRLEKRELVIGEILQTERDYLHGLTLTMETFLTHTEKCPTLDLETLFGNIDEVIEVSQKLLTSLEGGSSGKDFDKQLIGESFVVLKEEMKQVYAPYCRNHDDVIAMLEKYEENEEIQEYFNRMLAILRQRITVFDLGSMLIKPVQRILKYPLLLNELIKATEDDHIDKQPLLNAINAMTEVAAAINEYKRRKDLVLKYRTDRDQKLSDKIARLSVHSTKKKLSRISQRIVGIMTVDEAYNKEERKVTSLEKGVRALVRDVAFFMDQLQETIALQESIANDIADYYGEKSGQQEVEKFCTVHSVIATNLFHTFKFDVEGEVLEPLNRLLLMLSGPAKVMKKRHDKLLDYDNAQGKVKSTKDMEQLKMAQTELNRMKNDYEALNAQLLDELPRLYDLAIDIVTECIARLAYVQKQYYQKALDEMFHLLSVPLLLGSDDTPLIEAFNIAHTAAVEALSSLVFIPRAFNPRLEEHKTSKTSRRQSAGYSLSSQETPKAGHGPEAEMSQSEGQRVYLTQIYPADHLYRVISDVTITQPMDLACPGGALVGVIKEGDPMGNKDRWFVDNGAIKGFILKRHLAPYQAASAALSRNAEPLRPQPSSSPTVSPGRAAHDLMDLSSPPRDTPPAKVSPGPPDVDPLQQPQIPILEEKVDLSDTGVQSIDWGIPTVQPDDTHVTPTLEEEAEPSPPPAYSEYFRAVYPFTARGPIEVSMEEGQLVKVIQQRDLDGNSEWWLVEVDGKQGYAPSNYLYQATQ